MRGSEIYGRFARFYLMVGNNVLLGEGAAKEVNGVLARGGEGAVEGLVNCPVLTQSMLEFLESLQDDLYLSVITILNFMYYEPECEGFDVESLKQNMVNAEFDTSCALR